MTRPAEGTVQLMVRLTASEDRVLREVASQLDIPISSIVRHAVDEWMSKRGKIVSTATSILDHIKTLS